MTLLPRELFTSEALGDLDAAVVAAAGDESEDDDEENEDEEGCDPILQLEAANRGDTEEMEKLQELGKGGSPGYSVDTRGLCHISDRVYVPEDPPTLAVLLICHIHEQPSTGYPEHNCMVHLLSAGFHLKNLAQRVAKYLKNCSVCCKLARHTGPPPVLRPRPVPDAPWRDISVNFVGPLPVFNGYNMIMVVVDRLTELRHYIPCMAKQAKKGTWAPAKARLFLNCNFRLHGLPETIVLDRGPLFIPSFSEYLTTSFGIKRKLSVTNMEDTGIQDRVIWTLP